MSPLFAGGKDKTEEMDKLKAVALASKSPEIRKTTIDSLEAYGQPAIPAITAIVADSTDDEVKTYGLNTIKKLRSK
jgi:hypothetical protein